MPRDLALPTPVRILVLYTLAIAGSQLWPGARTIPLLPGAADPSRSPSSDALMQALPLPNAAQRLDAIARSLPGGPGVVVAHGPADQLTPAYYVAVMHLWPRPVHLVVCEPAPYMESFRAPALQDPRWRIDFFPRDAQPVRVLPVGRATPRDLCGAEHR